MNSMLMLPAFVGSPELNKIYHCDALTLLKALPDGSVDLIAVDPPYFGVKDDDWDNQWPHAQAFIAWLHNILKEYRRVLKANGSLYLFASPQMSARVEIAVSDHFNVLNRITWNKSAGNAASRSDKDLLRSYIPNTESIIFAEQYGADKPFQEALIDGNATYWGACETLRVGIFGDYLTAEFERAKVTRKQIASLFPSKTGGLTGCVSNWLLGYNIPTPEQYQKMRDYLNGLNGRSDYLRREYEDLRREYEDLRREYEDLRREYEDLRRPFDVSPHVPYTDVWDFKTVQAYEGKHPCEKPMALMKHIISASSRAGDVVLDTFAGSGTTLDAARQLGRRFIGCDFELKWVQRTQDRLQRPFLQPLPQFEEKKFLSVPIHQQPTIFESVWG